MMLCLRSGEVHQRAFRVSHPQLIRVALLTVLFVAPAGAAEHVSPPPAAATQPAEYAGLHNVVTYASGLYAGSAPEGREGFATLSAMGIKTIISVDGAAPDVEGAAEFGLRYVHLPIGYDGMDKQRTLEIARAVHDLPGPVYIHCHHGQHRAAAATGAAAVTLGLLSNQQALNEMKISGTAPNYTGLFECVRVASVASPQELTQASNAFPSRSPIGNLAQVMVHVDETMDNLKQIEKAGWKTPKDHPDLVPAAEAGRLADFFRNAPQPKPRAQTEEFTTWIHAQSQHVSDLEKSLLSGTASPQQLSAQLKVVSQSCAQCHAKYRD
jgi:protein tyrosine phosphatase (PTP) superfamily phosphohydrolase (DUF442 family)